MGKIEIMNSLKNLLILAGVIAAVSGAVAADTNAPSKPNVKLIPDKLTTCPVSGEKLGEMGKPYVFEYKGREVKLCCPDCKKDFDKTPAKYMKKIEAADKKASATDKN
jgi:YHS domain-containing protein